MMYRILRLIVVSLTMWFDGLTDGALNIFDYETPDRNFLNKLDRDNKREIRTFDKDGMVGVTINGNGSITHVHGYLVCMEYEWKNVTFPSCQHVLIGASFVLVPKIESITVCLQGNPFSTPCQSNDNVRNVDIDDFGFIHPRFEPQYRVGDIAVLRMDDGLNNPHDNPKKWVYPKFIQLETQSEQYYGFVSYRRGVTRWKEAMEERNQTLMRPFKNNHPYPVIDICKNVSNAPRYYNGVFLGPWRSLNVSLEDDFAPLQPITTYIFIAIVMYDNRHNLFPDHGLLINMDHNTVMGLYAFENEALWNPIKHQIGYGTRSYHKWANITDRPILHPDHNDDRRINVQHFSILSYYLPWIYHMIKVDTENLMISDTDEDETTIPPNSTTGGEAGSEITTPIPDMSDIYYDSPEAFYSVVYDVNPCEKAVSHRCLPLALWTAVACCFTLCTHHCCPLGNRPTRRVLVLF